MRNLIMILLLLGSYPTYAETTIVRFFVNGEAHTPVVSVDTSPSITSPVSLFFILTFTECGVSVIEIIRDLERL